MGAYLVRKCIKGVIRRSNVQNLLGKPLVGVLEVALLVSIERSSLEVAGRRRPVCQVAATGSIRTSHVLKTDPECVHLHACAFDPLPVQARNDPDERVEVEFITHAFCLPHQLTGTVVSPRHKNNYAPKSS